MNDNWYQICASVTIPPYTNTRGINMKNTVDLNITISRKTADFIERYCSVIGVTKDYFIENILAEASAGLEGFLNDLEMAKRGELTEEELKAVFDRFNGVLNVLDRVKL